MAREKNIRKLNFKPIIKSYIPENIECSGTTSLLHEEIEAIYLMDVLSLYQENAAKSMEISRPTFTLFSFLAIICIYKILESIMKTAINVRLEENIVVTLDQLSKEFNTTKTDIIEKAIKFFSQKNTIPQNNLLKFAGTLDKKESQNMINSISSSKNSKEFALDI